jgi:hypothetical protein
MSRFGNGSNPNGQFWFGGSTFPGFLYKKNVGVGGRRCTKFTPGGNATSNTYQYIYNKYTPGQGGIGAQTVANRRAKNRHSTICKKEKCFQCYMSLGQYSNYTHNPNGFYNCLETNLSLNKCIYYQWDAYFATFRGNATNFYGQSSFNGPSTLTLKYTSSGSSVINISGSSLAIDENGLIYVCGADSDLFGLFCYNADCSLKWYFKTLYSTIYSIPFIRCDGIIYFTSNGVTSNEDTTKRVVSTEATTTEAGTSSLYAINSNGIKKWVVNTLKGFVNDAYPLIVNDSNVFVSTSASYVYIINDTGNIIKIINFGTIGYLNLNGWNSCYDIDTNSVFMNGGNYLFKINMITYTYISFNTNVSATYSIPIVIDNYVYRPNSNGTIEKYNKNNLTYIKTSSTYGAMDDNSIMVDKDENIYIGDNEGNFIKLDKNLNQIWKFSIPSEDFNAGSAILSNNGYIYLNGSYNRKIYCLNTDGVQISSSSYSSPNSSCYCSPTIGKNKLLYIGTEKGLTAYGN